MNYCSKCKTYTNHEECTYMHHFKCSVCGHCEGCSVYQQEVKAYNEMVNNPDYYFEPVDFSDTPESRIPKQPLERYTSFPSGDVRILFISDVQKVADSEYFEIVVTFSVPSFTRIAAYAGLASCKTIVDNVYFKQGDERAKYLGTSNSIWGYFENTFTKNSLDDWLDNITLRFKKKIELANAATERRCND